MVILDYIYWHFFVAPKHIFELLADYEYAMWHRFLITRHLRTLFAPWHRRKPSDLKSKGTISEKLIDIIADFYIRILAAFMRSLIIIAGLVLEIIIFLIFISIFFLWILWPLVVVILIGKGVSLVT